MKSACLLLALVGLIFASDQINPDGATCSKETGFMVIDNTVLSSQDTIVYKDTSEDDCLNTCSTNRDQFGRSILCSSFVYDHVSFTCTIYKDKSKPVGSAATRSAVGMRYFEKVCLDDSVPKECADSQFIRADDSVLVGFANNVTLVETMEQCVANCIRDTKCQSAMYFYEEGECITNEESALTKPDAFTKEKQEKVIYFQNGCLAKLKAAGIDTKPTQEDKKIEEEEEEEENVASGSHEGTASATDDSSDDEDQFSGEELSEHNEPSTTTTATPLVESEEQPSEEEVSEPAEKDISEEVEAQEEEEEPEEEEKEEIEEKKEPVSSEKIALAKKQEKASYIKFRKHPRNFASKTFKEARVVSKEDSTNEKEEYSDEGEAKVLSKDEIGEPVEGITKPLKKKTLKIKKLSEAEKNVEEVPDYFSKWSDWTPCTKSGERQIRRRKCLDLRRCLGALMQVRNCPAVLPASAIDGPIQSVRSVVGASGEEYDDFTQSGVKTRLANSPAETPQLPQEEPSTVWSKWSTSCQQFASGQPCNNGQMIGFESRECVAKEASLCEGPFFRYCTLTC